MLLIDYLCLATSANKNSCSGFKIQSLPPPSSFKSTILEWFWVMHYCFDSRWFVSPHSLKVTGVCVHVTITAGFIGMPVSHLIVLSRCYWRGNKFSLVELGVFFVYNFFLDVWTLSEEIYKGIFFYILNGEREEVWDDNIRETWTTHFATDCDKEVSSQDKNCEAKGDH